MSADVKALLAQMAGPTATMVDTAGQIEAATKDRLSRAECRNAAVIDRAFERFERMADHVSRTRFDDVKAFTITGDVYLTSAMGLIEWLYAMTHVKSVTVRVTDFIGAPTAYVTVKGRIGDDDLHVWANFDSPEAIALISECAEPSVHLLRRLQIDGVR
jgi:hypothetical protein